MIEDGSGPVEGRPPRFDVWRLGRRMLLTLVAPVIAAMAADVYFGLWPLVTLVVAGFSFPIAGFVVLRSALQEMEKVIRELAPADPEVELSYEDVGADETKELLQD